MARIRTIKPEFPQSESIGKVSRDARLLFVLLWTIVDDAGRTRAAPRLLASLLFPYDDDATTMIEAWLSELERVGCVRRYEFADCAYLDIPQWGKHQKIDKPSASRFPGFAESSSTEPDNSPNPREPSPNPREHSSEDLGPRKGSRKGPRSEDQDQRSLRSLSTRDANCAEITPSNSADQFEQFWKAWPNKIAKPTAAKTFERVAGEAGFSMSALLAGVDRYVRDKPLDRQWLNPTTFLAERRWEDEPAPTNRSTPTNGHGPGAGDHLARLARNLDAEMDIDNERGNHEPEAFDGPTLDLSAEDVP